MSVVAPEALRLDGQLEPLWRYDSPAYGSLPSEQILAQTVLAGEWTGADVVLGDSIQRREAVATDIPALRRPPGPGPASLRPATAAEWAALLDTAPASEDRCPATSPAPARSPTSPPPPGHAIED